MRTTPICVVIPERIPSLNKGEAAILAGIEKSLALLGGVSITVFSPRCYRSDNIRNYKDCAVVSGRSQLEPTSSGSSTSRLHYY